MRGFDTILVVDWSAAEGVRRAERDSIWIGAVRDGMAEKPRPMPTRREAETWLADRIGSEIAAGRRVMAAFDFPFGYPAGFAEAVTGASDPLRLWDWLAERIEDDARGRNNRFEVAADLNRLFPGTGPFWGKPHRDRFPDIPYHGRSRDGHGMAEKRACEVASGASSSVWQLFFNPTVGSQALMGLPMLSRLRRIEGLAVWPFEPVDDAPAVLAEIWPGLIEQAVRGREGIRDMQQVARLAWAFSRLSTAELTDMMDVDAPEEGWILGAGHGPRLTELAMTAPDPMADPPPAARAPLEPPPLSNDCFALPPGVHWTPVDEALDLLRARLSPVAGRETVPAVGADGRILAADAVARRANPPGANSAVDGYGFAHEATGAGPQHLPLIAGRAAAGAPLAGAVPRGQAVRILTGALIPEGVDTVVLEEDTRTDGTAIAFNGPVKRGANTRRAGEDVDAGAVLLPAGHALRPADLALLAATGVAEVEVFRRLRVGVLSTGDELGAPGVDPDPAVTYDANRPMLLALAARWGHEPVDLGHCADDRDALRAVLDGAGTDVIVTSGGASAGDEDHVSALLGETGSLAAWRIALKPGRPLALGIWKGRPVFGVPGNPVAAFTCALIFARPALSLLAGGGWRAPLAMTVPAGFAKRKKAGRREFLRARLRDGRAEVFASEGSGRISGLAWAEGFVELPDGPAEIAPGDPVRFLPYAGFGL
ncbi:molybdopterin molybdenumtransferase MoeA [Palleronia sediminis]|uniref:Molybdopterin molybdenumtransferase n=1 Tax=Palleronia sediminis TaxID=2547833 RepID=A0A4R6ACA2_9RHOB|nr:molybdopterin-binding protein [Palleronia sediminis]TDL81611.1 molybdopterin molybdenumtransferase MoeA [Palleronia sediminis]